jgi:hypothetical protein
MQVRHIARSVPIVLALGLTGGAAFLTTVPASASIAHSAMTVTESGKIAKFDSATSFTVTTSTKSYVVTTDAMTKVEIDSMKSKVSSLKKGETVTVKGSLEMDTITATSVVEGM